MIFGKKRIDEQQTDARSDDWEVPKEELAAAAAIEDEIGDDISIQVRGTTFRPIRQVMRPLWPRIFRRDE